MEQTDKLRQEIQGFLETYKTMPPAGRANFEAVLGKNLQGEDEKTKKLYLALLEAAKNHATVDDAIAELNLAAGRTSASAPQ